MNEEERKDKPATGIGHKLFTLLGIIICIIFIPVLVVNTMLIVKGAQDDSKPPAAFGYTPLVVKSGSMEPTILTGDLILVQQCDPSNLKVGEIITFMEGEYAVTHKIIEVNEDGTYVTKGDANNVKDSNPVSKENVVGKYVKRFSGLGNAVLFIQSTPGMLVCVGIPLLLFVIYDVIRRQMLLKKEKIKQDQLRQEIEELKQNPNKVDLPREVLKKPQEEAQVVPEQFEPAPERMAETQILEDNSIENLNNAEAPRCNEPKPQTAKVKVGVPAKKAAGKPATIKVKTSKK